MRVKIGKITVARRCNIMKRSELIQYLIESGDGDPFIIIRNDTKQALHPTYYSVGSIEADERNVGPVIIIGYEK
jgi:hypothetical protein